MTAPVYPPDPLTPWTQLHPYVVMGPRGFDGRYRDLRCAARTALHNGTGYWVVDQRSGAQWRGEQLVEVTQ